MRPIKRSYFGFIMITLAALTLAACDLGGGTTTITSGGSTTSTPIPTNTPAATTVPATCASALPGGVPSTQPGGANFSDVDVPANTFATALTPFSSGTGLWSIYLVSVCSQGISTSGIDSFFAAQLPGTGWAQTPKLPFDGGYQQPCGDAYCWAKDTAPRYVGLEKVTNAGNNVTTYQLRLFLPPSTPSCPGFSASPIHGYQSFTGPVWGLYIPLPPLTLLEPNDASGGQKGLAVCSAGTATSVAAFMNKELPKEGWTFMSASAGQQTWSHGSNTITWFVNDPTGWAIFWRVPLP